MYPTDAATMSFQRIVVQYDDTKQFHSVSTENNSRSRNKRDENWPPSLQNKTVTKQIRTVHPEGFSGCPQTVLILISSVDMVSL
jgi:hypothetical protein